MTVTFVMLARIPPGAFEAFEAYEAAVLPLLAGHGGRLERRLRSTDDRVEVHVVAFAGTEGYRAYREDPRRAAAAPGLAESGAQIELFPMCDLPVADIVQGTTSSCRRP